MKLLSPQSDTLWLIDNDPWNYWFSMAFTKIMIVFAFDNFVKIFDYLKFP
jgi:hypothetical protein